MKLLPQPQKLSMKECEFFTDYNTKIVLDLSCGVNVFIYAKQLQETISKWGGVEVQIVKGISYRGDILLKVDASLSGEQECYKLTIDEDGICLIGSNEELLLNGVQTLRQMFAQCGCAVPCLEIEDYPGLKHRGFYHDVTRGRVPTLEELKRLVDDMCYYKMNQLQLYVEHTYLFRDFSELWRDETPLTAEEILELDKYCMERHIDLIPSLSTFGHMYKLLKTQTYGDYCELEGKTGERMSYWDRMMHHTINVSHPKALELIKSMVVEYMSLFQSKYFNICCDETFDLCRDRSKHLLDENTTSKDIYTWYVSELSNFLIEKGKIPMFWGDILWGSPQLIQKLPKENICLNWGYAAMQGDTETRTIAEAGAIQYTCPGAGGWNEWLYIYDSCYNNIARMCTYAYQYGAIGVLNTDWGDFGHVNQPEFCRPGMIYGAAFSWNKNIMSFEEINEAISVLLYGDLTGQIMSFMSKAPGKQGFWWNYVIRFCEMEYITELSPVLDLPERSFYVLEDLDKIDDIVAMLKEARKEVQKGFKTVDSSSRPVLQKYLLGLDAMIIWSRVKPLVAKAMYHVGEPKESGAQVAAELETWFYYYKKEWRKVSREGDLAHMQYVVNWYADMIRKLG